MSLDTKTRVTVLENILGVPREGEQLSMCDRLEALSIETTLVRNDLVEQRDIVLLRVEELAIELDTQNQAAREAQSQFETEIALLKRAMSGLPREGEVATKVKRLVTMSLDTKTRVTVLENILGVPREGEQLSMCDRLEALSIETTLVRNDLVEQRDIVLLRVEELAIELDTQNQAAREAQSQFETEIALLKRAMSGLPREGEVATKVKVPKPKPFNGARNAKDLENFLWDMEQYFKAAKVPS
nr:hypothetical protein CFP56_54555 [Quercus suber]